MRVLHLQRVTCPMWDIVLINLDPQVPSACDLTPLRQNLCSWNRQKGYCHEFKDQSEVPALIR
ncbi:uncharacterized protein PHALS_05955 [Plasmopara halstedii]|uniref:Uncharacterized protein n=1 Tax=Plasmopara halstedii TaxID=4781 RepID=A0A0P1AC39_PLAHL|nr:uncharacterized protein PHALS_05955 [Plasmopara halstedii]CEG37908.1 hypothetical protein PHALS_05955 [Plasmopara halstedii]|eukprot:XP_024574277.1 hypothetical protein PHALS_05955 [Plasmopara halstedii]